MNKSKRKGECSMKQKNDEKGFKCNDCNSNAGRHVNRISGGCYG